MSAITSTGIGSGLDITNLVNQLVESEGAAQLKRLNTNEAKLQSQLSAVGTVKGALSDFQSSAIGLTNLANFQNLSATASNTNLYTATAGSGASTGIHSIEVKELATSHRVASKSFTDTTTAIGVGNLTFQFGTYDANANTFTLNQNKSSANIVIDATNNSLEGIRNAVNASNIGVTASIVNDGSGNRLVFASTEAGINNSLKIAVTSDLDGNDTDDLGLSQLAYDPTANSGSGKNLTQTIAAKNASLSVDGLAITSTSNTVVGAIPGVTINLLSSSPGNPANLTVSRNTSTITTSIQNFITKYNSLANTIKNLSSYDATNQKAGILLGDATLRNIDSQIQNKIGTIVNDSEYNSLASIGVTTLRDGTLSLDNNKLSEALNKSPDSVALIFASGGTPTDALITYKRSTSATQEGNYAINITQAATQGFYTGTAPTTPNLTIDNDNDTFSIKVNGVQSNSITLTQKTYATNSDLALEIQNKINSDSALKAKSVTVQVNYDTDHFVITSSSYGSNSKVEFTAVDTNTTANLGFATGNGTDGKDVAGTIDGKSATGFGQLLTGSTGNSVGLQVEVRGSTTGNRGSITFSRGIADQLNSVIETFLNTSTGLISSRTNEINSSIGRINTQRTAINTRLETVKQRYLDQFNAMDSVIASMKSTSEFLTNQFSQKSSSQ